MSDPIATGKLTCTGRQWGLTKSKRSAVTGGEHYILLLEGAPGSPDEELELIALGLKFAHEHAEEPGRFRVAMNGPTQRRREQSHVHIICPKAGDVLPKLVLSIEGIAEEAGLTDWQQS